MSVYIDDDREMPRFRVNRQVMVDPAVFALERADFRQVLAVCGARVGAGEAG